jgi:hypothetical protein
MRSLPILLSFTCLLLFSGKAFSQKPSEANDKPSLSWNGFVKGEAMFDSRQVVEAREGYLVLYPRKVSLDKEGNDINAHGSFNQYAMSARLTMKVTGPDVLGAKMLAILEGDFTGASNAENNSFRLRHAYVKMKWPHTSVIAGQYWHPINVPEMIPNVLSLNTGAPFHPFSRQPQVRTDLRFGKMNLVLAAASQRDYANSGPAGTSSAYLRNAMVPNLHAQLQYVSDVLFAGAGADFKRLTPRLVTDSLYATRSSVNCFSYTAFAMAKTKPLVIKTQWIYGQGLNDHLLLGGYAVSHTDPLTNEQTYTPLNYLSGWINVQTTGKTWQGSLLAGYTKGFGTSDEVNGLVYARDPDIAYVYRIAPMISYSNNHLLLLAEVEFTTAAYGTPDKQYRVQASAPVTNTRFSLSAGYIF